MSYMKSLILIMFLCSVSLFAQGIQAEVLDANNRIYPFSNGQFKTNDNSFELSEDGIQKYKQNIAGKKIIYFSPNNEYSVVANYAFPPNKEDYDISYYLFDSKLFLIKTKTAKAHQGVAHPICDVSDNGFFSLFDPLSFRLTIINKQNENEITLSENVSFEMERQPFIKSYGNTVAVAVNELALEIEAGYENVNLWLIDIHSLKFKVTKLPLTSVLGLFIDESNVLLSGVKFNQMNQENITFSIDAKNTTILTKHNYLFEKILKTEKGLIAFYGNTINSLGKNGEPVNQFRLDDGYKITNIIARGESVFFIASSIAGSFIFTFGVTETFELQSKNRIFAPYEIQEIYQNSYGFIIHSSDSTYIYKVN